MAALSDRQKARARLGQVFQSILDKMIPADEAVPLAGGHTFVEWEDLGDEVDRTLVPVFLEERAALAAAAHADSAVAVARIASRIACTSSSVSGRSRCSRRTGRWC